MKPESYSTLDEMYEDVAEVEQRFDEAIAILINSEEGNSFLQEALEGEGRQFTQDNFGCLSLGVVEDLVKKL